MRFRGNEIVFWTNMETLDAWEALVTTQELDIRFSYHKPIGNQAARHERVKSLCRSLAKELCDITPESREQSCMLTNLDQVMFYASAAIARREQRDE